MARINIVNKIINGIYILIAIAATFQFLEYCGKNFPFEFFINYNHGPIKRGFIGSILFQICSFNNFQSTIFIKNVVFFLVVMNIFLIAFAVIKKKLDFFILFTSTMLLNIYGKNIPFRLDLVIIPLFIFQLYILKTTRLKVNSKLILTSILLCLGIAIHEIYFLICSACFIYIIRYVLNQKDVKSYFSVFIVPFITFIVFTFFYKGNEVQISKVIFDWTAFGTNPNDLKYLNWLFSIPSGGIYIWNNINFTNSMIPAIGFILNYIILCWLYYFFLNHFYDLSSRKNRLLIFTNFSIILLLSCVAEDFIRWFYFMFIITLFYFLIFERKKDIAISPTYVVHKFIFLLIGTPMVGNWNISLFIWSSPLRMLKYYYYLMV